MRTSDAFYAKQIFYTFSIPLLIFGSVLTWCVIYLLCARRWKLQWSNVKHKMILTMTLMTFLCFPMLVKLCLSMFKCVEVGKEKYFLMADLQEPCFQDRHQMYIMLLSLPQLIVLSSLPLLGFVLLQKNKKNLENPEFRLRYGLLYRGYNKGREWWEVTVALRKVTAVVIGTFGPMIGSPEVQVGCALFLGLLSIVLHLIAQPFGSPSGENKRLHIMELYSLVVIWCTNWGGLMLYVSGGHLSSILLSIFVIVLVSSYNIVAFYIFGKTLINSVLKQRKERRSLLNADASGLPNTTTLTLETEQNDEAENLPVTNNASVQQNNTHIVPISTALVEKTDEPDDVNNETTNNNENENDDFTPEISQEIRRFSLTHTRSTVIKAHALHDEFHAHEAALKAKNDKKQKKQRRQTQNRIRARLRIRQTKSLTKVPMFKDVTSDGIESILELTTYKKWKMSDVLFTQGDIATDFYIIVTGQCAVKVKKVNEIPRRVGTLKDLDFFGESALLDGEQTRNATVIADTEYVQVLMLSRMNFEILVETEILSADVVSTVSKERERRNEETRKSLVEPHPPPPPNESV